MSGDRKLEPGRHVVIVSAVPPTNAGGMQMATGSLCATVLRMGLSVTLLAPVPPADQESLAPAEARHIPVPRLPFYHPSFVRALRSGLRSIISEHRVDVVISESAAAYGVAGLCQEARIPIILHAHGSALREFRSAVMSRSAFRICYRTFLLLVDRYWLPVATVVAAVTPTIGQEIARLGGPRIGRTIYLPNAVDTELFQPNPAIRDQVRREMSVPPGAKVVAFVGRLSPEKGPDVALKALPDLKELSVGNAVLWFIGDGVLRAKLERETHVRGLTASVRFWGRVSRQTVRKALAAADALVLPSRRPEGMPYAVLEAQAMGVPSVTPNVVDISPLPTHVFRTNDPRDLARAIAEALRVLAPDAALRATIVSEHSQDAHDSVLRSTLETLWSGVST